MKSGITLVEVLTGVVVVSLATGIILPAVAKARANKYFSRVIEGVVIKEGGSVFDNIETIIPSPGADFSNESVKFAHPSYAIQVKTSDNQLYNIAVSSGYNDRSVLDALNLAIDKGTMVRLNRTRDGDVFHPNRVEIVDWSQLEVIGNSN